MTVQKIFDISLLGSNAADSQALFVAGFAARHAGVRIALAALLLYGMRHADLKQEDDGGGDYNDGSSKNDKTFFSLAQLALLLVMASYTLRAMTNLYLVIPEDFELEEPFLLP